MNSVSDHISKLKELKNKIDYKIAQIENETLQKIFDKIKKDKEYKR